MRKVFGPCIGELISAITAQGIQPTDTFDFELSVPVSTPVAASGRVRPGTWPAMKMARTIHHGPYEGLPDSRGEFMDWIEANGHTPSPDLWECYLTNPDSHPDPATWRTELSRPLL